MAHSFGSLDELGDNYGFRKVRQGLGVNAFGVNAIVYPPGAEGVLHYHDEQDELYFVHSGTSSDPAAWRTSRPRRRGSSRTSATTTSCC